MNRTQERLLGRLHLPLRLSHFPQRQRVQLAQGRPNPLVVLLRGRDTAVGRQCSSFCNHSFLCNRQSVEVLLFQIFWLVLLRWLVHCGVIVTGAKSYLVCTD